MTHQELVKEMRMLGLTQKRLADDCGISTAHMSHIANGKSPIPKYIETILQLINAVNDAYT